ncbi:MAG TPA: hypothetical protein VKB93_27055 [Thermoanaerobaculia bacterium]|nr:hypothetical protein [Thermoanaerobaculia bacterium]
MARVFGSSATTVIVVAFKLLSADRPLHLLLDSLPGATTALGWMHTLSAALLVVAAMLSGMTQWAVERAR